MGEVHDWIKKATELFTFAELARFRFENGTLEEKKSILASLGQNLSLKDGKLAIKLEKPLIVLKEAAFEVKQIHARLEPLENALDKRKLGEIYAQFPTLHAIVKDVRTIFMKKKEYIYIPDLNPQIYITP